MNWYYAEKGQQIGPLDDAAFENLVSSGQIAPTTLVWNSGMTDWKPVAELGSAPTPLGIGPAAHCSECGGRFAADEMIQFGDVWVCANCKLRFTQKLREGVSLAATRHYGGFWIRGLAVLLDTVLTLIVFTGLNALFPLINPSLALVVAAGQYLGAFFYHVWFVSRYGGTLGKLALGLRVITVRGENLSLGQSAGRYFAQILSGVILGIGYIMAAFDEEKRSLHDRICNTRVVKK
jgi:uncharacterized RDD family membrane protein YckC